MDTIDRNGRRFLVEIVPDDFGDTPWDTCTPLAEVSDWTSRRKRPSERIVNCDRGRYRYYDFAEAVANLRSQRVSGVDAAKGADFEFNRFRLWCADYWSYVGVKVTLLDSDGEPAEYYSDSLYGIESDDYRYHKEIANELADQICHQIDNESGERDYWANHNLATVGEY